ncbi:MAG TPA: proline dehydrogenase family protein [Actinomycetes bacterium]|nr:proline dehydrogenase family protein [Actinomycetes bacterium]
MVRGALLALADNQNVKSLVTSTPRLSDLVTRFAAGETDDDAIRVSSDLRDSGFSVTLDYLGEDTHDREQADLTTGAYIRILHRLKDAELTDSAEVSVKLSAIGQALPGDGQRIATDNARQICEAADAVGTTVTLDMEEHTTTDMTLETLHELRADFPGTGAVLQAYLRRTEQDCRDLAVPGSRVRLCKGAYAEPESVAFQERTDIDRSYVRCMKVLLAGSGYPMFATHDPRLISIAEALTRRFGRDDGTYEYQMLFGVRRQEQRRLLEAGERVRIYVPYGTEWYGYLVRRMAERPANLALGIRAILDHHE